MPLALHTRAPTAAGPSMARARQGAIVAAASAARPPAATVSSACNLYVYTSTSGSTGTQPSTSGRCSQQLHAAPLSLGARRCVACAAGRYAVRLGSREEQAHVGVVIVDHGSRKKDSNLMLNEFGRLYEEVTGAPVVEIAHMELAEPTIEQAIGECPR